jgi:hypothetical protein
MKKPKEQISDGRTPILCTHCEHPYMKPCHGEDKKCPNALWLQNKGKTRQRAKLEETKPAKRQRVKL